MFDGREGGYGFLEGREGRSGLKLHCFVDNNDELLAFSDAYRIQLTPSDSVSVPPLIQQYV